MPSAPSAYKYRRLKRQGEIRLVALAPGSGKDAIHCDIIHAKLQDQPYQALSYEWGRGDDADPKIAVKGLAVQVRMNLYEALKQIRDDKQTTILWIDALCINQSDVKERNDQVKMMGEIYKGAEKVIVWLGEAKDDSDFAMDLVEDRERLVGYLEEAQRDKEEALVALCERSYWHRVWVAQEMFLARDMMIRCGDRSISGEAFARALAAMSGYSAKHSFCGTVLKSAANGHRVTKYDVHGSFHTLRRWLNLSVNAHFSCTEPRDAVYALLGVAVDCPAGGGGELVPDYEKPLRDLYIETVHFCAPTARNRGGFEDTMRALAEKFNLTLDDDLKRDIAPRPGAVERVVALRQGPARRPAKAAKKLGGLRSWFWGEGIFKRK